jgi:hypothetical protein
VIALDEISVLTIVYGGSPKPRTAWRAYDDAASA